MAFIEMFLISLLKIFMVIKSKRSYLLFGFDIVMITTKQTEARRWSSWTWSWSPTSCGPSISSLMIGISWLDGSLIVELFKQRCFAGRDVFCRFSFMASLYSLLRSLFIMALFGHKLCTYRSESLEFQLEL